MRICRQGEEKLRRDLEYLGIHLDIIEEWIGLGMDWPA